MQPLLLLPLFFMVAIVYSMVGFGGGSSYIALLVIFDFPYQIIPPLALICNIIVVTGGSYIFIKAGHFCWRLLLPFIITSIPAAYLAGTVPLDKHIFLLILSLTLLCAGIRMLLTNDTTSVSHKDLDHKKVWAVGLPLGAGIGALSGFVGIGGGIFLSPILHNLNWGKPKQISALASVFILVNSIFGLIGQLQKHSQFEFLQDYFWLPLAVLIGGQIGSQLGANKISPIVIRKLTAVVVLVVALRILVSM